MSSGRRNILVVAPFLPYPPDFGGALRVYHLVRGLQRTHNVHVVAPVAPDEAEHVLALGELCDVTAVPSASTARQPALANKRLAQLAAIASRDAFLERSLDVARIQAAVDRIFLTRRVDLVQHEFTHTALVRPTRPVPNIIDAHNIEHDLLRRVARTSHGQAQQTFNLLEWRKVRRLELRAWKSATLVIATSAEDAATVEAASGAPVAVVPNGVDVDTFANVGVSRRMNEIVFVGAMRHYPNADGARWYVERVHPIVLRFVPDAILRIVGADPPADVLALSSDSIIVTGRVERIEPYLAEASVAIVPLHSGGGTRLKILEAFAARTPVVSTTIGAEGIVASDGTHLFIRDSPESFAETVIAILRGAVPHGYSPENGFELARERYDWDTAVIPTLVDAHERAIEAFAQQMQLA